MGLDELDDLIAAVKWFHSHGGEIQKRPRVVKVPNSTAPLQGGNFSHMDTLNIFKWTKLAILHPMLATNMHKLIMDKEWWDAQKYDLHIGTKLEYMLNFMAEHGLPEEELDRLLILVSAGIFLPWRLCHYDCQSGARKNEIDSPGAQAKYCLEHNCPYFHTKGLKQIMDEQDVKPEDQLDPHARVPMSSTSSDEEDTDTVAKQLQTATAEATASGSNTGTGSSAGMTSGWQQSAAMAVDEQELTGEGYVAEGTVLAESHQNGGAD